MEPVLAGDEAVSAFAGDGVVCVREVLSAREVTIAAAAIDVVLARRGPLAQVASGGDDPGSFVEDFCRWREVPQIEEPALQPGDAIFFDFLAVHGAPGFPYRSRRRVLSLRYLAAAARHSPRPWRTSPPFDGLQAELPAGAAMDHPLFPVVRPPDAATTLRATRS